MNTTPRFAPLQKNNRQTPLASTIKQYFYKRYQKITWTIIAFSIVLFFIPFAIPSNTEQWLGAYAAISAVPVVIAALLQRRKGSIISTGIIMFGLGIFNTVREGFPWPLHVFLGWITGGVGILIFALAIGQYSFMRYKIIAINADLSRTHAQLLSSHEGLQDAHDELKMLEEELRSKNQELLDINGQLSELAMKDSLTRIFNHRAIVEAMDREFAFSVRHEHPCAILFFDLDFFKVLNDTYGHPAGDAILLEFAQLLQYELRQEDIIGRWGGEEFLAILPETPTANAIDIAERICRETAQHTFVNDIRITCSIGVSIFPDHGASREAVLMAADDALYAAKKLGRNRACLISDEDVQKLKETLDTNDPPEFHGAYGIVKAFNELLEARDSYTGSHTNSVSKLSSKIALHLGLNAAVAHMVEIAGQLHDLGKIGIPDAILRKPGKLNEEEWELMRQHPRIGANVVDNIPELRECIRYIHSHHERWDGNGYPDQLAGNAIPLGARIIAVVDTYDAIVTDRPYHTAQSSKEAITEIQRCSGTQFDPAIVEALVSVLQEENISDSGNLDKAA